MSKLILENFFGTIMLSEFHNDFDKVNALCDKYPEIKQHEAKLYGEYGEFEEVYSEGDDPFALYILMIVEAAKNEGWEIVTL